MGRRKGKREFKPSSGLKKKRKINKLILQLSKKVLRWNRYVEEILSGKRQGPIERWNTDGLEKEINFLSKYL